METSEEPAAIDRAVTRHAARRTLMATLPHSPAGPITARAVDARGILWLMRPKLRTRINRARTDQGRVFKGLLLAFVTTFFWAFIFGVIFRMLLYFRGTQGIGDLLAGKLLGLAFLTFLSLLLLSNVITALSTFFLSEDLELLLASPTDGLNLYGARLTETIVSSSWMVALMAVPLLAAYGVVYEAGPLYYLLALAVLLPFLVVPAVIGSAFTLLLVNVFPARRTRDLLAVVALLAAGGVLALFRFVRPERLMRPEEFRSLVDFMAVLRTPSSSWLPSEWAADTLMGHLSGTFDWFPFLFLLSTAAAFVVFGVMLHLRYYGSGFTRAQEGAERREGRVRGRAIETALAGVSPRTRELVAKEVRVFFRDTTQWSQLVLLGVLVVVYVYNIKVLPLYTGERVSFFLINAISFLNLGLAGFVVAAIAARFVFPAMSLEGRMMWLLRSSPLDVRTLFWCKYWVGTIPLLLVALPLIVGTNVILDVSPFVLMITTGTMVAVTFALTSLALGFGALFPNYETENVAEIPTSFGGLLFMMAAVIYLAGVVIVEAWPVYFFLRDSMPAVGAAAGTAAAAAPAGTGPVWPLILGLGGAALLTLLAISLPLVAGVRRVRAADF
jgi:ABC-2 type transport system permease protein